MGNIRITEMIIFYILVVINFAAESSIIPNNINVCNRNDPYINQCLKNNIMKLRSEFPNGIKELFIPPLEPLHIPEIKIKDGPIFMNAKFDNILIHGISNFAIKDLDADINRNRYMIKLTFPSLTLTSRYNMEGKLMMAPLQGSGELKGSFTNFHVTAILNANRYQKTNSKSEFLELDNIDINFSMDDTNIDLGNLFDNESSLGATMNSFLSENWKSLDSEIRPVVQDSISELFRAITGKFFSTFSLDELFPV